MKRTVLFILGFLLLAGLVWGATEGDVIITEIMYNAASNESTTQTQFIEIANMTGSTLSLNNWTIDDEDADGPNILPNIIIPAYGIIVLCGSSTTDFQGAFGTGFAIISFTDEAQTMINLSNSPSSTSEIIQLRDELDNLIDEVNYDDSSPWPTDPGGVAVYLDDNQMNYTSNDSGANWSNSQNGVEGAFQSTVFGVWNANEIGSPGNINGETVLPVNLSSFYALYISGTPTLYWTTQTEENNAYWNVYRGTNNNFEDAALFNANDPVPGNGTTTTPSDYVYVDTAPVIQNTTYWYWIEDVSTDGETTIHEPITLSIPFEDTPITPDTYGLHKNYPNPFNPSTSISFTLAEESDVELIIYNMKGEKIKSIFNDHVYTDQITSAIWDGNDEMGKQVSSGVYFYKLITDTKEYQRKMLLVK